MATSSFGDRCRMVLLCLMRKGVVKDVRCHIVRNYVRRKLFQWDTEQMKEEAIVREFSRSQLNIVRDVRIHIERFDSTAEQDLTMTKLTRMRLAVGGSEVPIFYNYWVWL